MPPTPADSPFVLEEALAVLEATPGVLRALFSGLSPEWAHFAEAEDAWSPHTVLVHFVHNETTNWVPRARVILGAEAEPTLPPFNQMPGPGDDYPDSIPVLLDEFARLRQANAAYIRGQNLGPAELARQAQHPTLGRVTLRQLLATWVVHDLNHTQQIAKSVARRYEAAVGPWRQYLAVLDI